MSVEWMFGMRKGRFILIVGPDGCGKSSLALALCEERGAIHRYWRPKVLPIPSEIVGGRGVRGGINEAPHDREADSGLKQAARLLYYFADFLLGHWFVFSRALRRGTDVVVERGWADMIVDPKRYGFSGVGMQILLLRLLPAPDYIFLIEVDPDIVLDRKRELTRDEIIRQYVAWRAVPVLSDRVVVIRNEGELAEAMGTMAEFIER